MTAPEPTPTAEHIDAVARALSLDPGAFTESTYGPGGAHVMASRFAAMDRARKLLASENPTVHAALAASLPADVMLAALVRAGVLTEESAPISQHCGEWFPRWSGDHDDEGRRLVTPWEVAP